MSASDYLLSIGVNTGNSLDAADVVLTKFGIDGSISDLDALSVQMPEQLADSLRLLRSAVVDSSGDMEKALHAYEQRVATTDSSPQPAAELIRRYTLYVAGAVKELTNRVAGKIGSAAN